MRTFRRLSCVVTFLLLASPLLADFPVAVTPVKIPYFDVFPAAAFNSTNNEYLVVWTCLAPWPGPGGIVFPWAGWVLGQRVSASGSLIGDWFVIFSNWMVVNASVAYNSTNNEFMVVSAYGDPPEIYAQRVSNTGTLIGSASVVLSNAAKPKILFNTLSDNYLVLGNGGSNVGVLARVVTADGGTIGNAVTAADTHDCPNYSVAFAPIVSPETPYGRYLLASSTTYITMLDSYGNGMITWYDNQGKPLYKAIPFSKRTSSETTCALAFGTQWGYGGGGPSGAFMMAYGAKGGSFQSTAWPGIWASFVNPDQLFYLNQSQENCFPVSYIYQDAFYASTIDSWMPAVDYNPVVGKFFVVWREVPSTTPTNEATVPHIRGDCALRNGGAPPVSNNYILSALNGTENPQYPAIASNTNDGTVLVVWIDMRDSVANASEIYGTVFDIGAALPIELSRFSAHPAATGTSVLLEWTTLTETENYGFEIQRRLDGTSPFANLPGVFIPGHGTTVMPQSYSYTDATISPGRWWYRLKQMDLDKSVHYSEPISVDFVTGVEEETLPTEFALQQNYPNPFNPTTVVSYQLPVASMVRLVIFDLLGREVAVIQNDRKEPGKYAVKFDASNLPSGIYLYRIQAGDFVATRKLVVLK
jgi:hypothetical protein